MIRSFCIWCSVKKATEQFFPYCSAECLRKDKNK